jgi:hypothetical protein
MQVSLRHPLWVAHGKGCSSRVLRKLRDERGDTGNAIRSTWLDVQDGEWVVTGGAERGGRCELGEARPVAAGLEEDKVEEVMMVSAQVEVLLEERTEGDVQRERRGEAQRVGHDDAMELGRQWRESWEGNARVENAV